MVPQASRLSRRHCGRKRCSCSLPLYHTCWIAAMRAIPAPCHIFRLIVLPPLARSFRYRASRLASTCCEKRFRLLDFLPIRIGVSCKRGHLLVEHSRFMQVPGSLGGLGRAVESTQAISRLTKRRFEFFKG